MRTPGSYTSKKNKRDAKQRAWNSMRWLGTFTLPDILSTAEIKDGNARNYLRTLEQYGYVTRLRDRRSGYLGGHVRWRLARNTGPLRPLERADGTLYDQNLGELAVPPHELPRMDRGAESRLPSQQPSGHCEAAGAVGSDD